jgi:hypothetical protein
MATVSTRQIRLNKFRRISYPLITSPLKIYEVPFDRAGIVLIALGSNVTNAPQTVTVSISSNAAENGASEIDIVKNVKIGAYDAAHLTIGKVVLTDGDVLYANCSGLSSVNLTLSILETLNT